MTIHAQRDTVAAPLHSYIMVRSDLPLQAQMAQCAHAAQEAAFLLGRDPALPIHVVILSCPSEEALLLAADRLTRKGFDAGLFHEPDWPRGHTALYLRPQQRSSALRAAMGAYPLWSASLAQCFLWGEHTEEPLNSTPLIASVDHVQKHLAHSPSQAVIEMGENSCNQLDPLTSWIGAQELAPNQAPPP